MMKQKYNAEIFNTASIIFCFNDISTKEHARYIDNQCKVICFTLSKVRESKLLILITSVQNKLVRIQDILYI